MATENKNSTIGRPLVFGEVLFDHFPDGSRVLGGAPFNVAWHLHGFQVKPLFVSRIGDDIPGREVLEKMALWGMDTRGVQRDQSHPTGAVQVSLLNGQPSFEILPEQAYDYIERAPVANILAKDKFAVLYHGSLAARGAVTQQTLHRLSDTTTIPAFVDINLRAPWWTQQEIRWNLHNARWLKLNSDEFSQIAGDPPISRRLEAAHALLNAFGVDLLIITLGAEGALLVTDVNELSAPPSPISDIVDTVGAGDAFSAVTLFGLLHGWEPVRILNNALDFAAEICRIRGATVLDCKFYQDILQRWDNRYP